MADIVSKNRLSRLTGQAFKNLGVVLFNFFASVFNWFVIVVCLIILLAGYLWLIKPKYDFIASDQELNFQERQYETKVGYLKQLTDIKNLYKTINQGDKDKIDTILSVNQDLDRLKIILLKEISQLSKEQQITIDNIVITPLDNSKEKLIKVMPPSKNNALLDKLRIVQVSFTVKGVGYDQVKKLITRLEGSLRLMDVTSLSFNPTARTAGLEIYTYFLEK